MKSPEYEWHCSAGYLTSEEDLQLIQTSMMEPFLQKQLTVKS